MMVSLFFFRGISFIAIVLKAFKSYLVGPDDGHEYCDMFFRTGFSVNTCNCHDFRGFTNFHSVFEKITLENYNDNNIFYS